MLYDEHLTQYHEYLCKEIIEFVNDKWTLSTIWTLTTLVTIKSKKYIYIYTL